MKKLIVLFAVAALLSVNAFAKEESNVPANVKSAFAQKFPAVTKVKWENENGKEWEAAFKMDGKNCSASFDMRGNWMETESKISAKEIPAPVQKTITTDFKEYKVKNSELAETANGKVYEFEIRKGAEKKEIEIDATGKVIKNEVIKAEVKEPVKKEAKEVKEPVKKEAKEVKEPVKKEAKEVKEPVKKETKEVKEPVKKEAKIK